MRLPSSLEITCLSSLIAKHCCKGETSNNFIKKGFQSQTIANMGLK